MEREGGRRGIEMKGMWQPVENKRQARWFPAPTPRVVVRHSATILPSSSLQEAAAVFANASQVREGPMQSPARIPVVGLSGRAGKEEERNKFRVLLVQPRLEVDLLSPSPSRSLFPPSTANSLRPMRSTLFIAALLSLVLAVSAAPGFAVDLRRALTSRWVTVPR